MWIDGPLDASGALRQGDLLRELVLPKVQMPFSFVNIAQRNDPRPGDKLVLDTHGRPRRYLVVSQCCEIEKGASIAVAPIVSTGPLTSERQIPYKAEEPTDPSTGYVFSGYVIEPLGELFPELTNGRLLIADLTQIQSVIAPTQLLVDQLCARMTVQARRLLRIKLSSFWSRPEADDEAELMQLGLPVGATPPVPANEPSETPA